MDEKADGKLHVPGTGEETWRKRGWRENCYRVKSLTPPVVGRTDMVVRQSKIW